MNVANLKNRKVLVIGDLMADEYLWGDVERISPEAPVPIVAIRSEEIRLGGAGNVISNLVELGAAVSAAGVIGADAMGDCLLERFKSFNVNAAAVICESGRATTRKTRILAAHQHVLRFDRETLAPILPDTENKLRSIISDLIPKVEIVLISDYGKGLLTKTLISDVVAGARRHGRVTIVDPKGRDFTRYNGASFITPNRKEAGLATGLDVSDEKGLFRAGQQLIDCTTIERILITCGPDGMVLFERGAQPYKIPAEARQVFDVSGAGDTVVAVLGMGLAAGLGVIEAARVANTAAGIVVGKVGTATVSPWELEDALQRDPSRFIRKDRTIAELRRLAPELRRQGKRIVLTNGCFDLIHVGHLNLFSASRELGDVLIVALDDDASVAKVKGKGRPVIGERERVRILSALDCVDHVVLFNGAELDVLIDIIRPDVLTKGGNYTSESVHGREAVERYGGRVAIVPITRDVSATEIIAAIKSSES